MNEILIDSKEKIVLAALELFYSQGIKKTSMAEVAAHAGVTRMTVYRYFAGKRDLVREAVLRGELVFQQGAMYLERNPDADIDAFIARIEEEMSTLPTGDILTHVNELKQLYPQIYREFQEVRIASMNGIFDHLISIAQHQERLRPNLNLKVVRAIFWEAVVNIFENADFNSFGLTNVELYHVVADTLLHGIMKSSTSSVPRLSKQ